MECKACELELERLLCEIPTRWREQIIKVICDHIVNQELDCAKIKECLSAEMDTLDPQCLTATQSEWEALTFLGKIQKIIDKICEIIGITQLYVEDTISIDLGGVGSLVDPFTADLIVSPDPGNIIEVRANGVFAEAGEALDVCAEIDTIFSTDVEQQNTTAQNGYRFLAMGQLVEDPACQAQLIAPPTGFAVTGSARVSAFGAMEWFDTLTLANASAVAGETVLIYDDTVEALIAKQDVNYAGIGLRNIGSLDFPITLVDSKHIITNLNVVGATGALGSTIIQAFTCRFNDVGIASNVRWTGGHFDSSTVVAHGVNIEGSAVVSHITSSCPIAVRELATLTNFHIYDEGASGNAALFLQSTSAVAAHPKAMNGYVRSTSAKPTHISVIQANNEATLSNVTSVSDSVEHGIYAFGSDVTSNIIFHIHNCTGISNGGSGIFLGSNDLDNNPIAIKWNVSNNVGISNTGSGIFSAGATISNCKGYSKDSYGISAFTANGESYINECVGESRNNNGLYTNIAKVYGGTYISHLNSALGNPIYVTTDIDNIVGVKTIAKSDLAYAVKAAIPMNGRIAGSTFLNESGNPSLAIDLANITLTPIIIDAYGNIR